MEEHRTALALVCRVGGVKFSSLSRPNQYPVADFAKELAVCFGVDVSADHAPRRSPAVCVSQLSLCVNAVP